MSRKRKFSLAEALESELICPITYEMPAEPVYAEDGRLYERSAIEQGFAADNRSSPMTKLPMGTRLVDAVQVRNVIERIVESGELPEERSERLGDGEHDGVSDLRLARELGQRDRSEGVTRPSKIGDGAVAGDGDGGADDAARARELDEFGQALRVAARPLSSDSGRSTSRRRRRGAARAACAAAGGRSTRWPT